MDLIVSWKQLFGFSAFVNPLNKKQQLSSRCYRNIIDKLIKIVKLIVSNSNFQNYFNLICAFVLLHFTPLTDSRLTCRMLNYGKFVNFLQKNCWSVQTLSILEVIALQKNQTYQRMYYKSLRLIYITRNYRVFLASKCDFVRTSPIISMFILRST